MKILFLEGTSLLLLFSVFGSFFFQRDFSFGLFLFYINFIAIKIIARRMLYSSDSNNVTSRYFYLLPAFIIKMTSIAVISYLVLVYLDGNAYFFIGGFGFGLLVFSIGTSLFHFLGRKSIER